MEKQEFLEKYRNLSMIDKMSIELSKGIVPQKTIGAGDRLCYAIHLWGKLVYVADSFSDYENWLYDNGHISEKDLTSNPTL